MREQVELVSGKYNPDFPELPYKGRDGFRGMICFIFHHTCKIKNNQDINYILLALF